MACRGAELAVCIIAAAALRIDHVLEGGRHRTRMRVLHPHVCTRLHARVSQAPVPAPGCFHLISSHLISSHLISGAAAVQSAPCFDECDAAQRFLKKNGAHEGWILELFVNDTFVPPPLLSN